MHLRKIPEDAAADIPEENFVFGEGKVQGAKLGKSGGNLLVKGAKRFKLYAEGTDLVKIISGTGHFKWKGGETDFSPGDCLEAEAVGEYEVNGSEKFLVVRK